MTVKLSFDPDARAITRETCATDPVMHEILMVRLGPTGLTVWQKGRRFKVQVSYRDIWRLGYQRALHAARGAKS